MIHQHTLTCPSCKSTNLAKNGLSRTGVQRWRCNSCRSSFQLDYQHKARKSGTPEIVIKMHAAGLSMRQIAADLNISPNTVKAFLYGDKKNNAV